MNRLIFKVLMFASLLSIGIMVGIYGFMNSFNYSDLTTIIISLWNGFLAYVMEFAATLDFNLNGASATYNYIIIGGLGLSLILALVVLVKSLIVRRPLLGLIAALSIVDFFSLGMSAVIRNEDFSGDRFVTYLINLFNTDMVNTLFFAATFGFTLLSLLMIFLLGLTSKSKVKVAKQPKIVTMTPNVNQTLPLQPTLQASAPTLNAQPTSSSDNLSELVKIVMQEELNMMRNTQQIYPNPAMGVVNNPYATSVDLNLVKRIVIEELAKFQSQYISRAEAQTLIAQEIAMIKAQLRIK